MTGAVIALSVKNPVLAVPLSFISHFFLDAISHYGSEKGQFNFKKSKKFLIGDFTFALILMLVLAIMFPDQAWLILVCMIAAAIPDLLWAKYISNIENEDTTGLDPLNRFHWWLQWKEFPKGIYIELAWFITMSAIIFILR